MSSARSNSARNTARLAELVSALLDCDPDTALSAVHAHGADPAPAGREGSYEILARAMSDVERRQDARALPLDLRDVPAAEVLAHH